MTKVRTQKKARATAAKWVCPSCKNRANSSFCPACGESRPANRHLKPGNLFAQFFHAFSTVDGRLIRTVRYLIARPGVLTTAYMQGRRVPYLGPFQLFVVANVLFFAMQSLTNTNIVSSSLDSHLHTQDWSLIAQGFVDRRLAVKGMSLETYAPLFNQAIVFYGKTFIILMALPFTLLLFLMSIRPHRPFVTHVIFSLHFYTFLLLLFCASLVVVEISLLFGGPGLDSPVLDNSLTLINFIICSVYLYAAIGVVYGARTFTRIVKSVLLGMSVTIILLGYRFALFLLTLYST